MADDQKYFIRLHGTKIEVSEDVYYAYYRMERQERWQEEKSRSTMLYPTMRWIMVKPLGQKLFGIWKLPV